MVVVFSSGSVVVLASRAHGARHARGHISSFFCLENMLVLQKPFRAHEAQWGLSVQRLFLLSPHALQVFWQFSLETFKAKLVGEVKS